jgi:hypothetical protein
VQLQPLLNGGPSHRLSEAIGQQRLIWFKTGKLEPGTDVLGGFLPKGHHALLSAFAQQLDGTVIVSLQVLHPDGECFGDTGSGVVGCWGATEQKTGLSSDKPVDGSSMNVKDRRNFLH